MAHAALDSLLRYLRRVHDRTAAEATDGELRRRYAGGDEAAFAALVRRHAAMVWGVCRRLLDNEQDAEDAFQAAFLVLLRKVDSLRVPQSLAAFLHGVASRIAQKARVTAQRRQRHETQAERRTASDPMAALDLRDLRMLLTKGDYSPEGKDTVMNYSTYLALDLATAGQHTTEDTMAVATDLSDVLQSALDRLYAVVERLRQGPRPPPPGRLLIPRPPEDLDEPEGPAGREIGPDHPDFARWLATAEPGEASRPMEEKIK